MTILTTLTRRRPTLEQASALAWGLQFSFLTPSVGILLSALYGATAAQIGTALIISNAAGFVASLLIPAAADRRRDYLTPMLACGALTLLLAAALWFGGSLPVAVAALTVLGAPAGVGSSLLFAQLRHSGQPRRAIYSTRAVMSFAWVAGPPIASLLVSTVNAKALIPAIGLIAVANIGLTWWQRSRAAAAGRSAEARSERQDSADPADGSTFTAGGSRRSFLLLLGLLLVAFVALQATNNTTTSVMNLFIEGMGAPLIYGGIALAVAAIAEIPALLAVGRVQERLRSDTMIIAACVIGIVFYLGMTVVASPIPVLFLQLLNAAFFSVVAGVGLTVFQDLLPTRPGLASGLFTNTRRVGSIVSGGVIALGASGSAGYSGAFAVCAALTAVALLIVLATRLVRSGRPPAPAPGPSAEIPPVGSPVRAESPHSAQ